MRKHVVAYVVGAALVAVAPTGAHAQSQVQSQAQSQPLDTRDGETEVRLMQMEGQLRKLTGQYEEAMYRLTQTNRRLERALEDLEYRVRALEQKGGADGANAGGTDQTGAAQTGAGPTGPGQTGAVQAQQPGPEEPAPVTGNTAPQGSATDTTAGADSGPAYKTPPANLTLPGQPAQAPAPTPETAPEQFLQGTTPDQQFAYAFSLLRRDDLDNAEKALRAFLALHPDDKLAANAQYWLGKTYFARGDYDNAARVLLKGYQEHGDSDKGPDILLNLALSLSQLGQKKDACAAFDELSSRYPNADVAITQRAKAGRRTAGCS